MSVLKDFGRACVEESSAVGRIGGKVGSVDEVSCQVGWMDRW